MGGIDESALDRLSLVTEMTKHVRVRAAAGSAGGGGMGGERGREGKGEGVVWHQCLSGKGGEGGQGGLEGRGCGGYRCRAHTHMLVLINTGDVAEQGCSRAGRARVAVWGPGSVVGTEIAQCNTPHGQQPTCDHN